MKDNKKASVYFSIIMPCYNVADYIEDSVSDIIEQDFSDWELILVDDASGDGLGDIADELATQDDRISVIHFKKNKGVSAARNKGLSKAKGEYILFLDPDDRYEQSMLDIYHDTLRETNADIVVCSLREEYEKHGEEYYSISHSIEYTDADNAFEIAKLGFELEKETMYGYPWNKVYRRKLLVKNKIEFPGYSHDEDIIFNIHAFKAAKHVTAIPEELYHYKNRYSEGDRLTDRYVPDYFIGKKRRITELYRQYKKFSDRFTPLEKKAIKSLLAGIYFRSLASAVERMIHAGLPISRIKKFLKREMAGNMYRRMKKSFPKKGKLWLFYLPLLKGCKHISIFEILIVSFIKRHFGQVFAVLKQSR